MNAQELKIDLILWLEGLNDLGALQQLAALRENLSRRNAEITQPGNPMTEVEYKNRIHAARHRIKNGQFTTMEDLEKEMEEW